MSNRVYTLRTPAKMDKRQSFWRNRTIWRLTCGTCNKHSKWYRRPSQATRWLRDHMKTSWKCVEVLENPSDAWLAQQVGECPDYREEDFDRFYE